MRLSLTTGKTEKPDPSFISFEEMVKRNRAAMSPYREAVVSTQAAYDLAVSNRQDIALRIDEARTEIAAVEARCADMALAADTAPDAFEAAAAQTAGIRSKIAGLEIGLAAAREIESSAFLKMNNARAVCSVMNSRMPTPEG